MVWLNDSQDSKGTPCDARTGTHGHRTGIVRAPYGNLQCFSYPTGPVRGPRVTRKGAVRRPYGHVRELTQPQLAKIPHGRHIWPYGARTGPLRPPHGLFTGYLHDQNPYGARKLIMHALKLYGPRTGRQNSYGAVQGPYGPVSGRTIFVQNSPGTARTGPGRVMWLRHKAERPPMTGGFPHKGSGMRKAFPCYDVIIGRHVVSYTYPQSLLY